MTRTFHEYLEELSERGDIRVGVPLPLGAHQHGDGVNFALFSRHATRVYLEFYERAEDISPTRVIELDPRCHRSGDVWHVWVRGVRPGQFYAYRVDGPYEPAAGHRFNVHKLLLDPYATAVTHTRPWNFGHALGYDPTSPAGDLSFSHEDDAGVMPKCVFTHQFFDWEEDRPLRLSGSEMIIYETHVRGLTIHASSGVDHPGTYRGLVEKLPYLKDLGITAIELMPIQEFNEFEINRANPLTGEPLRNYWGYNPVAFMAPKARYASAGGRGHQKLEFMEMVKACHRQGMEVILDVVFNHTAEGNEWGPTLCWRGIENSIYYILAEDKRYYKNFTGTGNTFNANHPVVRDYILDTLRYWVMEMHVDGFRFDLAAVLGRDEAGQLLHNAPLLERIAEDPILREVKIIAEAWDAAGAYEVGSFAQSRWAEWNGRYRDDVRRFWRGDEGMLGLFAYRICGSSDLYQRSGKGPECSVNYITSHDGFTLNDLVSYRFKHNEANGEDNRDGTDENFSDNYGVEGPTNDPNIESVRKRQIKNFLLTLLISRGVPMILGGDEFRRTQRGNNNAYCQDNDVSWYDWTYLEMHHEIYRFTKGMIALRKAHPVLRKGTFYTDADISWFSPNGDPPDWFDPSKKRLACHIFGEEGEPDLYLMFNAHTDGVTFRLPALPKGKVWHLVADTAHTPPTDIHASREGPRLADQQHYRLEGRSSVILEAIEQE